MKSVWMRIFYDTDDTNNYLIVYFFGKEKFRLSTILLELTIDEYCKIKVI